MRTHLLLLPLLIVAAPAAAQVPGAPPPPIQFPPQLIDPAMADKLANTMQALSRALLDLPVGEVQAAIEGRPPTPADRHRTVRSETGMSERDLDARITAAKPQVERSVRALNRALPEITRDLQRAQQSVERAIANMPDPTYPKR